MPGTALHLLLVAAVVVCTHGDTLGDTTHCSAATDHDLGPGDVTAVLTKPQYSTVKIYYDAYVKPKEGFEGVSVKVEGDRNSEEEAWFPANETCLPTNGSWWKVNVQVLHKTKTLSFRLYFGKCDGSCYISESSITRTEGILVKAHGPSSWNTTLTNCTKALEPGYSYFSNVTCDKPPTRTIPPTTTNPAVLGLSGLEWGAVALGLVVVVVVTVIVVCCWHRRRADESRKNTK